MLAMKRCLVTTRRRSFSPEFKRNAAARGLDQSYDRMDACRSNGVAEPEQQRIQELEAYMDRLELKKTIL